MSRRSDPVDPLLGCTLFPKAKFSSDPSKPYDFDHDLHLNSTTASLSGLKDQAKNIFSGSSVIPQSDMSQALKCVNGVVPANDVDNHRERRPAFGLKRARFSLEPNSSQPDINLGPTFDSKKYKEPDEYLTVYERNENAKRELEKQMGGAVLDGDEQNPSSITGARRPGILQRSVKYKHRISSLHNEIIENAISTQETFETSILSPLNHSSQTKTHEKVALEEMDLAVKEDNKWNNDILDGLLSQPTEDLEGDGAFCLLKESLHIKYFELEDICLPEFPDTKKTDLKSSRKTLPNPRPVKPRQRAEGSIHLASPTPPKRPLALLSLLSKRSLVSIPSNDPFSAFDIDQFPVTNPSSVENRNKQSDRIGIAEQKMISDMLKSPLIKQGDKIEGAKTGSCEVAVKEFTNASKRSKRDGDSLSKLGFGYEVDTEEEIKGSKVTSETLSMPEDDTDTWANGVDNSDKILVEDKLQEAVKVPKKKPCKGKPIDKMDDLALLDELINEGEDSLHINVDLDTGKVDLTEEEALLEIPDEFVEAEEDLQSSVKKKRKHHHHRDSEVTYTGKNVVGADAKKPRVSHQMTLETSQSLGLLAPNVPVVPKKPIKQLFSWYGVADEKFVRSMLADLKDIDLDRVRAKDNSPQENRRIARESMMRALYNLYSIDASEEGTQLKEEVSNLSGKVKYLHGEKGKLEKERDALNQNIAALTLKVSELEEERKKIPALEVQVEALRKELEPLRGFEEKANSWKAKAEYLEGQIDEERHQAVEEYKGSQELVDLLLAARSKCISEKYREWSASGWIDAEKMKREVAEMKRKRQEEQARKEAESKSGSSGSHTEAQE